METDATKDPQNVLKGRNAPLDVLFSPRSVAVVGATEKAGSVGRTILWNLIRNPFGGTVYPINPKRPNVLGIRAWPSVKALPEPVDLAVIVTPAPTVPGIIAECVESGVRGAIVISAGFKEIGPEGVELERQVLAEARRGSMRLIGPNCLGVMNPVGGLNATFASAMARPGNVGMVSQSGALLTAILDWSFQENVGFSRFVSLGSMLDVGWGDLIDYLGDDPQTKSIVLYMETIGDARAFLSAAREVALTKPIIVIKAGRTAQAAKAAASHTGSLAGSDDVLDAAFRRCGVLRVDKISDLFYLAEVLSKQPRPKGPRLTIVTNAGGPGVLATDALITTGGQLAEVSDDAIAELNTFLPASWSHGNPIDVLGDADPARYARAVEIAARDRESDGMLVILTPQAMTDPTQTAEALKPMAKETRKPLLASWMGGADVAAGEAILSRAGIPTYRFPDEAAHIFTSMWRFSDNLRALYETPTSTEDGDHKVDVAKARSLIARVRKSGRELLTEVESKELLALYGIPTVPTRVATSEDEAAAIAAEFGFPAVLKLHSETITHKTDVGGVMLNLKDEAAVREAFQRIRGSVAEKAGAEHFLGVSVQPMVKLDGYELIVGSSLDAQFGPVLLFGSGGQLVEVFKDRALGLPPLTTTLARRMMERTRIYEALQGVRGRPPVDMRALESLMVRFSRLVVEQPWVKELDINPLVASHERLVALDARVVLHGAGMTEEQLPRPAIRPYPEKYVAPWRLADDTKVFIRPIRPEDEPLLIRFHETLSDSSVRLRYFHAMKLSQRVAHERLTKICFIDYDREMALVAERRNPETGIAEILGIGRLSKLRLRPVGEFAILVTDKYQRKGLGSELLKRLVQVGRDEGLEEIGAEMLTQNVGMQKVSQKLGFTLTSVPEDGIVKARLKLEPAGD
jgi:acetyltransferase